jgi:hypothetical protein
LTESGFSIKAGLVPGRSQPWHSAVVDRGAGVLARAAVQIPVVKSFYGDQKERGNVNARVTFVFWGG